MYLNTPHPDPVCQGELRPPARSNPPLTGRDHDRETLSIPVVVTGSTGLQDGVMSRKKDPRSGGPRPRRSFTPAQKLDLLTRYEQAVAAGEGGAFLRRD